MAKGSVLGGPSSGGGGVGKGSTDTGVVDPASALPTTYGPDPNTGAGQVYAESAPAASQISFGTSFPFGGGATPSGGGGFNPGAAAQPPSSVFNTISDPSGTGIYGGGSYGGGNAFETGAAPFETFGGLGAPSGGPTAAAAGVPTGVAPTLPPDPTQTTSPPTAATGASAVAPPAAQPSGGGFSLESLVSGIAKPITQNPLGFLGGLGSIYNAYKQQQAMKDLPSLGASAGNLLNISSEIYGPAAQRLQEQATQLNDQGQQLAGYLLNGELPEGLKTALDKATRDAKTRILSNFASRGMPTDPSQNSVLAQELAAVDAQAVIETAKMGQSLLQSGQGLIGLGQQAEGSALRAGQLSSDLYKTLVQIDQSQTQQIGQSIANFAAAISPSRSTTLKIG